MKSIPIFIIIFLFSFLSLAGDLKKGLDADISGDYSTAIKEWTPFAKQGHVKAQYNLGLLYHNGEGIIQDYKQAIKWYIAAAKQGHDIAQYSLGQLYRKGEGVIQDYKEAAKWYMLSAKHKFKRFVFINFF